VVTEEHGEEERNPQRRALATSARRVRPLLALLSLQLALSVRSEAQAGTPVENGEDDWKFTVAPYLWVAGIDGDLTIDGQEFEGDGDRSGFPGEISLSGFLGHFEARKDRWSFALSPVFIDVEMVGEDSPPLDSDLKLAGVLVDGFAAYELAPGWEVLGGVRYYDLDAEAHITLEGDPQPTLEADKSWLDPIVGVRYAASFDERWSCNVRADVGGFGIGSDFAWNASALVGYEVSRVTRLFLGYRALAFDFADGSGSERVEYDVRLWGPIVGVSFCF
jgi:hypothetical protein